MMCRMDSGISLETLRRFPNYRDVERVRDRFDDPWKRPVQPRAGYGIVAGQGTEEASETHQVGRSLADFDGWGAPRMAAPAFVASK
jgi:hypothetical protein